MRHLIALSEHELLLFAQNYDRSVGTWLHSVEHVRSQVLVLVVKKYGRGLRFCFDFSGLNGVTRADRYHPERVGR